jgi:hypothetical protein
MPFSGLRGAFPGDFRFIFLGMMSSCHFQACGARFLVTDRARHNREDCANRKVPCKNWECGCHQMIRIRMRKLHEKVRKFSIIPSTNATP